MVFSLHRIPYTAATAVAVVGFLAACSSTSDVEDDAMVIEPADDAHIADTEQPPETTPQAGTADFDEPPPPPATDPTPPPSTEPDGSAIDESSRPPATVPDQSPAAAAPPPDDHLPATPQEVTNAQIEEFASVYIEVMELQLEYEPQINGADDRAEAQQLYRKMERKAFDAVESHDLTIDEFHAIAHLLETDDALRDRIQSEVDEQALEE